MFPIDLTFDATDVELNDIKMLVTDFKLQVQYAISQNEENEEHIEHDLAQLFPMVLTDLYAFCAFENISLDFLQ
ncbi:hypothetical protein GBA52_007453 [Prunus armeniaca]|nr:hypothetical protein GBA52_007453 [Prunus armeniaca]